MKRVNSRNNIITKIAMLVTSVLFFLCVSNPGYQIVTDSPTYFNLNPRAGIRPLYPLYLAVHRMIFVEIDYLRAVVFSQTILAITCSFAFVCYLKKIFKLTHVDVYICYVLSLLAYTIDWPSVISSQYIMTEALSYPMFYIYMITLLQVVYKWGWKSVACNMFMAFVLSMIRTQLQLVCAISAFVIVCARMIYARYRRELYKRIDEAEQCHQYRPRNLWTWDHIVNSSNENAFIGLAVIDEYYNNLES